MPLTPAEQQELQQLEGLVQRARTQKQSQPPSRAPNLSPTDAMSKFDQFGRGAAVAGQRISEATGLSPAGINPGVNPINDLQTTLNAVQHPIDTGKRIISGVAEGARAMVPGSQVAPDARTAAMAGQLGATALTMTAPNAPITKESLTGDIATAADKALKAPEGSTLGLLNDPASLLTAPTNSGVRKAYKAAGDAGEELSADLTEKSFQELTSDKGAGSFVKKMARQMDEPGAIKDEKSVPDLLKFRRAISSEISAMKRSIRTGQVDKTRSVSYLQNKVREFGEAYKRVNGILDDLAPKIRQADALKTANSAVAPFREFGKRGVAGLGISAVGGAIQTAKNASGPVMDAYNQFFRRKR